ncbi:hypothetical protein Cgig2_018886 [Carnegiea gigantea]|uniref:Reverse transcriptase zinc-binding domain-containing protein n=1 Tax=Carnegiea gigantea TaxID=171969 RepID=A0A9Q1QFV5_9CARY|nr:hypothetical protein Cgig2_018886 [Carnegiea gigantea]
MLTRILGGSTREQTYEQPTTFMVIMPKPSHLSSVRVCDLIDHDNACWQENLVREYFSPVDAEVILTMPLCASWPHDKLIWRYSLDGAFSVRSAYHMIVKSRTLGSEGSSHAQHNKWKALWKLCLLPRIKIFAWRICKRILPTNSNLAHRLPSWNMNCPICGHYEESDTHALLEFPLAVQIWGEVCCKFAWTLSRRPAPISWCPPQTGMYMLNFDGGKVGESGWGRGVVIRKSLGDVMITGTEQGQGLQNQWWRRHLLAYWGCDVRWVLASTILW